MSKTLSFMFFSALLAAAACSGSDGSPVEDPTGGADGNSGGGPTGTGGMTPGAGGTAQSGGGGNGTGGSASGGSLGAGGSPGAAGGAPAAGGAFGAGGSGSGGTSDGGGSLGCGKAATRPDPRTQQTIQVGGLTRYYLMYVPENYDPDVPLPVVFGIHGLNMNNVWAAHDSSGFKLIEATANQALLIYPQGIQANGSSVPPSSESQWGTADSNWGGPPPNANAQRLEADLAYFDAMLDFVKDNYCVDEARIFSVGFSQGGFMTNALGCERASVFRGLAPVAGWGPLGSSPSCSDATASHAVIQTQGTTDTTVTPQLGEATRDFWRTRAGCDATTMSSSYQGCVEFQGCDADKPVIYCTHGGDHFVPDGAGARAWDFFQSLD